MAIADDGSAPPPVTTGGKRWVVTYTYPGDTPPAGTPKVTRSIVTAASQQEVEIQTQGRFEGWGKTITPLDEGGDDDKAIGPPPTVEPPPAPAPTPVPSPATAGPQAVSTGTSEGYAAPAAPTAGGLGSMAPATTAAAMTGLRRARRLVLNMPAMMPAAGGNPFQLAAKRAVPNATGLPFGMAQMGAPVPGSGGPPPSSGDLAAQTGNPLPQAPQKPAAPAAMPQQPAAPGAAAFSYDAGGMYDAGTSYQAAAMKGLRQAAAAGRPRGY